MIGISLRAPLYESDQQSPAQSREALGGVGFPVMETDVVTPVSNTDVSAGSTS